MLARCGSTSCFSGMVTATPPSGSSRTTRQQIVERLHLQRQHDGVHVFAAESRVVHERRKRVADGIAGHAEDARRLIELIDAVEIEQRARRNLARRGLCALARRGKSERRAGARAQHAADQPFFAHGDAHDVRTQRVVFNHAAARRDCRPACAPWKRPSRSPARRPRCALPPGPAPWCA